MFHLLHSYKVRGFGFETVMSHSFPGEPGLGVVRPAPGALVVLLGTSSGDGSGRYAVWVKVLPSAGAPGQKRRSLPVTEESARKTGHQ